ncbi:MAG: hypothetical protein AAGI36_19000 [Pseudomonadota bacterium]
MARSTATQQAILRPFRAAGAVRAYGLGFASTSANGKNCRTIGGNVGLEAARISARTWEGGK